MGLLFVFDGEENAPEHYVDVDIDAWHKLLTAAKGSNGAFPLVRRLNDYYRDARFDADEIRPFLSELECLSANDCISAGSLVVFVRSALAVGRGISVIAD